MAAAKARRIDAVLVFKLDRWGRSVKHLVNPLRELRELGVEFISLRDGLDTTTAAGRLQFHMSGLVWFPLWMLFRIATMRFEDFGGSVFLLACGVSPVDIRSHPKSPRHRRSAR